MTDNDFDYLKGQALALQTAISHLLEKLPQEALTDVDLETAGKNMEKHFSSKLSNSFATGFKDTMEHFIP